MNPLLQKLRPYPFERLQALFATITPSSTYSHISLGIGEPKHATPPFIIEALCNPSLQATGMAAYPATVGTPALRAAIAKWLQTRYGLRMDPGTQILPVNGSREALFAFAQTVIDTSKPEPIVVLPNPFYQIYEGATLLAGATPHYVRSAPERNFAVDWDSVSPEVWARTQLLYVCSPSNPTGAVMSQGEWEKVFALSDQYGFVIASDECYSEIYFGQEPPLSSLEASVQAGRVGFQNLMAFTSLSKRSNVPGLRSGFVAGDARLIASFLRYRTYHGSAMSEVIQAASALAWGDEAHVHENRRAYRTKFEQVTPLLASVLDVALPDAAFYLWAGVPKNVCGGCDERFAAALRAQYNVTVLPGSYLAREVGGVNPGAGRIRLALVAPLSECLEAVRRIAAFVDKNSH